METSYIAERCGNFCQVYHTGLNKVIRRAPYSEKNFNTIIKVARKLGIEEWKKLTERKISGSKKLQTTTNESILDKGVTTMEYTLPTEQEIITHMGQAKASAKYKITFKPTEKTAVVMGLTHGPFKLNGIEYARAKRKYSLQLIEIQRNKPKVISDEPCKDIVDAINRFLKQIDFCCKMYGRVQPIICKWQ